jgi:hypothetical protein
MEILWVGFRWNIRGMITGISLNEALWDMSFSLNCILTENIIILGDLNFNLRREEILGPSTCEERLAGYFIDKPESTWWVDVKPIQLCSV